MKIVKFLKNHSPYVAGETASFSDEDADVRIQAGVAQLVKEYKIQPDQRVETRVDADGHTVIETKIVPDDLERNVELPPTEGGGQPKDEAHMTDEEKARAKAAERGENVQASSVEQPDVNKMVKRPAAKK